MKTGEPGLGARAVFPSEATFRALQQTQRRLGYTPIPGAAIATVLLRGPLGPQGPCSFDRS